jgi:hypothetical protein
MLSGRAMHAVRATRVVLCALLLAALGGCSRDAGKPAAPTSSDVTRDMRYTATATGALNFTVEGTYKVRVLRIESDDAALAPTTLLSVGPGIAVPLPDGRKMRVAFDLQRYKGDGTYRIKAGAPRDLVEKAKEGLDPASLDQSNVLVQLWPAGVAPTAQPQVFDRVLEPCPLEVSDDGNRGHLHCPRMAAPDGGEFVLDMRWSRP